MIYRRDTSEGDDEGGGVGGRVKSCRDSSHSSSSCDGSSQDGEQTNGERAVEGYAIDVVVSCGR
jgi:hypothetical protein